MKIRSKIQYLMAERVRQGIPCNNKIVATETGINPATIGRYVRGADLTQVDLGVLARLMAYFEVASIADLIEIEIGD